MSKPAIKPDPVSDISKLFQPSAGFQMDDTRLIGRLADIRVALLRIVDFADVHAQICRLVGLLRPQPS